jgi:hypothetical protein
VTGREVRGSAAGEAEKKNEKSACVLKTVLIRNAGMPARLPVLRKTPFAIDPEPLRGACSARAGLAGVSRVYRALGLPGSCAANLSGMKSRQRGLEEGQAVECLVLLHAAGGDCMDDMERLREDEGLARILGYEPLASRAVKDFLARFHDGALVARARETAVEQELLACIPEATPALAGLGHVLGTSARQAARVMGEEQYGTVDLDGTIIAGEKRTALRTCKGLKGYQPLVAAWAETGLILADEFRDGNVPGDMAPLNCTRTAFAALPGSVAHLAFRGDTACHEGHLLSWLDDPQREGGPTGRIDYAVGAPCHAGLVGSMKRVPEAAWVTQETEEDGTLRQWADLDYVPGARYEDKELQPRRHVGIRLLKAQGLLFADGSDRHYHALVTNRTEAGGTVVAWHREKAGTIEQVHDQVKNGLGGGRMPSGKFGANAAWFRIACIACNIILALRAKWPDESLRTAHMKRLRFSIFNVTGRVVRDRRRISLRLAASREWIQQLVQLFEAFPLATQSTG